MATTPNLAMVPSGRKATKLYSVLPTDGTGDFTVARASQASEINSDLKIQNVANDVPRFNYDAIGGCPSLLTEPQSTNLITYPVSFGNSYWTKSGATIEGDASTAGSELLTNGTFTGSASSWTLGAGVAYGTNNLTFTAATSNTSNTTPSLTINKMYLVTYEVTNYTSGTFWANLGGTASGATNSGNGTFTDYITTSVGTNILYFSGSGFSGTLDNISVKEVQGFSSPHVDYPTSAFKLVMNNGQSGSSADAAGLRQLTDVPSAVYSFSVYAKAGEFSNIRFRETISTGAFLTVDLTDGTVTNGDTNQFINVTATLIADGWYRIAFKTPTTTRIYKYSIRTSETGDGTSGVYIFGAQFEQQSVATSFMYNGTEGATVTRIADVQSISAVNSTPWDFTSEDFSMMFDINVKDLSVGPMIYGKGVVNVDGWYIQIESSGRLAVHSSQTGANQTTLTATGAFVINTQTKIVITRSGASVKIYKDGVDITLTIGTHINPDTASIRNLYLGNYFTLGYPLNGEVDTFQIYTTELTPTEVANL